MRATITCGNASTLSAPRAAATSHCSGKKKAHKHKFFVQLVLGRPRVRPSDFTGFIPWDKSGENLQVISLFYTVEARFHRVCPWDKPGWSQGQSRGRRAAQKVYVKKVSVPFLLANCDPGRHVNVITPCLLAPCLNVPNVTRGRDRGRAGHSRPRS